MSEQAGAAEATSVALEQQLATAREQQDATQQLADSLQTQLAHSETQLQAAQQQNSRLLADVVAAQRRAAEVAKEKGQVAAELAEMRREVTESSGLSQEIQHQLQAASAAHALAMADLRSAHLNLNDTWSLLHAFSPLAPCLFMCRTTQRATALDQVMHVTC